MCDTLPLDDPKIHIHTALLYITWGLIWDQGREHLQETIEGIEVLAMIDLDQGPELSTNRDRIRCYVCRDYDHFARNCPNSREERDLEQLQHMLNMEEQDQ